jgi:uncharacterized protein
MAEFFHGIRTRQVPTSLVPPANVPSALTMAWGCAPIHRLSQEEQKNVLPGSLALFYTPEEAAKYMGIDNANDDFGKWGLSEVAFVEFVLFKAAPVIFVNLFNPEIHKKSVSNERVNFAKNEARLENSDIIGSIALTSNSTTFVEGTDYRLNRVRGTIIAIDGSSLATAISTTSANITASYTRAAPELVTVADAIGGYDIESEKTTGLELAGSAFPAFRTIPTILIAPGFSEDLSVAAILAIKTQAINGVFTAGIALADIPTDKVPRYTNAPKYKNDNNLVSENLYLCWGKIVFGDREIHMSTQVAGICSNVDRANGGIPFASPSNKNLQMQKLIANGEEVSLGLDQVNFLNANGIATALNFSNGWVLWGNRTACFPGVTDPKDTFLPYRRFMAWYGNRLILTWIQKIDFPLNLRQIQTILSSERININSLRSSGILLGGDINFKESENSLLSLMDGMIVFHIGLGFPPPNEAIEFLLEYDPSHLQALFA